MKITSLLIQYLYDNQRLELPGIGIFTLDRSIISQSENPKQKTPITEGITFESKPGLTDSPELIAYISAETGKMKSLATADLDSRIELAKQFLNIGKPFTFEGLGTLIRRSTGEVEFKAEFIVPAHTRPAGGAGFPDRIEPEKKYQSFLTEERPTGIGKPVIAALVIGGILLAVVAGYFIARKPATEQVAAASIAAPEPERTPEAKPEIISPDTTTKETQPQPTTPSEPAIKAASTTDSYKYILEVAKSERAFKRYNQLRTNLWKVELETKDSVQYKLFLMLPAMYSDTTRIMDSLTVMLGRPVYIEHQN